MELPIIFEVIITIFLYAILLLFISLNRPIFALIIPVIFLIAGPQYYFSSLIVLRPAFLSVVFLFFVFILNLYYDKHNNFNMKCTLNLVMIGIVFICFITSFNAGILWNKSLKQLVYIVIIFFSVQTMVKNKNDVHFLLKTLVICGIFISAIGLLNYFFPGIFGLRVREGLIEGERLFRTNVEGLDPNGLASTIMIIAPITYYYFARAITRKSRIFYAGVLSLFIISTILTVSRMGFLLLIVFSILVIFQRSQLKKLWIFLLIISIIIYIIPSFFWARVATIQSDSTGNGRLIIWNIALQMFKDNYLLGVGYGNFQNTIGYYSNIQILRSAVAHNMYLEFLTETGIFSFLFFMFFLVMVFYKSQKVKRANSGNNSEILLLNHALRMGIIIYLIQGLFLSTFETELFFIYVSLIIVIDSSNILDFNSNNVGQVSSPEPQFVRI